MLNNWCWDFFNSRGNEREVGKACVVVVQILNTKQFLFQLNSLCAFPRYWIWTWKIEMKKSVPNPKMEIFYQIQKDFATMGINSRSSAKQIPLNARNFCALCLLGLPIVLQCVYLNKVASAFQEYIEFIKIIIAMWTGTTGFAAIIWNMPKLFRFIDSLQTTINSEYTF